MKNKPWQVFSLLYRHPAFGRLWVGRSISLFGDAFTMIALPWFVLQVTDSGTATAGILLSLQLPAILTSMAIGSLIDRFQPRAIITIDNGLRTLIIGTIPILHWFGLLELWLLFLLTFLAGLLVPATEVGSRSVLPDLVEDKDLDAANMLWSFGLNLSLVVGPAVAGLLVASFGGPSVLLIDAATFAVMALVAATMPNVERGKPSMQAPRRVFGARSTLLTGGSPLGLAVGGILLAFVPATSVIAFSELACILVGLSGLASPTFRGLSLPSADSGS